MTQSLIGLFRALTDPEPTPISQRIVRRRDVARANATGMVQHGSLAFSIWQLSLNHYGVVRLIDDAFLGTFRAAPDIKVYPEPGIDETLLLEVARKAKKHARTADIRPALRPHAKYL